MQVHCLRAPVYPGCEMHICGLVRHGCVEWGLVTTQDRHKYNTCHSLFCPGKYKPSYKPRRNRSLYSVCISPTKQRLACIMYITTPYSVMCSFDVKSLFTNVPLQETIIISTKALYRESDIIKPRVPEDLFVKLVKKAKMDVEFRFAGTMYRQTDGMAMGSPLGPVLANIYRRYVDDTFAVFESANKSEEFLKRPYSTIYIYIYISRPFFMFGRALSWGSAFAVCIVHCSLVYQFEHSGKVRRAWFKFGFENFYSSLLSGSASFLCAALMSPQRTKQYCPQIEYFAPFLHVW